MKIKDQHIFDLIKGGGINFIFYGSNLLIVYLLAIVIAKYYGADTYGRYSTIKSLVMILIIITTLGLNTLAIKLGSDNSHYSKGKFKSNFVKKSYVILLFSSGIISCFLFLFKKEIAIHVFDDIKLEQYLTFFPLILVCAVFLNFNSNLFKGQKRVLLFSFISSFLNNFIFIVALLIIFNWFSENEIYLILSFLGSIIIALVISVFKVFPIKKENIIDNISIKKLISLSYPMMLSSSMIYIVFSVDTLMLAFFDISENVGIYRVVTQISTLNTIFLIVLGTVLGPKIAGLYFEGKKEEIKKVIAKGVKLIFIITVPLFLGILIFSEHLLLFFGTEYLKGYHALILLSTCQFLYAISGFVDLILNMTGKQKVFGKITMISAGVNLIMNVILIPKYGITGAAVATSFSILLTNILAVLYIKKNMKIIAIYIPFIKNKLS
jgi:O-antigen/teichoic acid export membrane protein